MPVRILLEHLEAGETIEDFLDGFPSVSREQACGIGEIGLDYHYDLSPRAVQQAIFEAQLAAACDLGLPVAIHTREATDDTFRILRDAAKHGVRGVFHCFTGDDEMARRVLDLGFHLSFAGIVTFPRSAAVRDAARLTPADRLLAETDAPYLAPVPFRGRRNEPQHVVEVYRTLAGIRGEPVEALAAQVTANFETLFGAAPAVSRAAPVA